MADDHEERVRRRAYRLSQEEGCPEGRANAHWDLARELVAIEENQKLTTHKLGPEGSNERRGEPVEQTDPVRNEGEFPTLTDQGEGQPYPSVDAERDAAE